VKLAVTRRKRGRIEIIPLIDIVFFLLATFVMVSLSMEKHRGVKVNLPSSQTADERKERDTPISISVLKSGDLFLDGAAISVEELRSKLQSLHSSAPQSVIALQGDKEALLGRVITVLDDLRQIGFTNIAIRTAPKGQ